MAILNPYSDDRIKRYGPAFVDLFEDSDVDVGIIKDEDTKVFTIAAFLDNLNVLGTNTVDPIVTLDDGTTGQNISAATTLTSSAVGRYWNLAAATQPYAVTGSRKFRLHVGTKGVGQATTTLERTDNIALITTGAAHNLNPGDLVWVKSLSDATFNGKVTVLTTPSATTFTYLNEGVDVASTADAAGRVGAHDVNVHLAVLYF